MSVLSLIPVALSLSLNNFAVSLALGALGHAGRRGRIVIAFGAFEFGVPLAGMAVGRAASGAVAAHASWLGALLLAGVGLWTVLEGLHGRSSDDRLERGVVDWWALSVLAAALSLDNLIVGFGLGLRGFPPVASAGAIGACVVLFILLGLRLGSAARRHWERRAKIAAGGLLIMLAAGLAAGWF